MKRPTDDQFAVAVEWLLANEGEDGEAEACKAVADWIEAGRSESYLRTAARKAGVPVAALRKRLHEQGAK